MQCLHGVGVKTIQRTEYPVPVHFSCVLRVFPQALVIVGVDPHRFEFVSQGTGTGIHHVLRNSNSYLNAQFRKTMNK